MFIAPYWPLCMHFNVCSPLSRNQKTTKKPELLYVRPACIMKYGLVRKFSHIFIYSVMFDSAVPLSHNGLKSLSVVITLLLILILFGLDVSIN